MRHAAGIRALLILCLVGVIAGLLVAGRLEPLAKEGLTSRPEFSSGESPGLPDDASSPAREEVNLASSKLSPALRATLSGGAEKTFLVVLTEQADLSHVAGLPTKEAKGRAVYDALRAVAQRTQAPLRAYLDALGIPYRPFYIVNMLSVRGDAALARALAARPDVARLEANPAIRAPLPAPDLDAHLTGAVTAAVEWGIRDIRADQVWGLGYSGQGIVVAGQDTGYDWDHPALQAQYQGWDGGAATHDYNWHDAIHENDPHTSPGNPCGFDSPEPCDDDGHGTHTLGTMVGDDGAGEKIGVAPGARWIACRNMEQRWGTPATYAECFQFFLAPYPFGGDPLSDGDPDRAPHVINNSWTCPTDEGCDVTSLRDVVENVRAAGIVVVVSAGNSGSRCESIGTPPSTHDASFTVGATDSSQRIASFSSRGPVTVDGSNRPKPDVSAPGVGVRSSIPGGDYGYSSGTSMAAPHVAGLVALLWSAAPHLVGDVDRTERLIQETARPVLNTACGGDGDGHPNNVYGWGIVDALAAVSGSSFGLDVSAQVEPRWVDAGGIVTFTFAVTNTAIFSPASGVVLTDTLPLSTTFAGATGVYSHTGARVTWSLGTISAARQVSVTLVATVSSSVPGGAHIVNSDYGARSRQVTVPARGSPAVALVPWRFFLPLALQSW